MLRNGLLGVWACLSLGFGFSSAAWAEQSKTENGVTVHYNAFNSATLTADVARQYQITRGGNQGVLTLSVKKADADKWLTAQVKGSAKNLLGQSMALSFKLIKEPPSIYYLAVFRFDDKDFLNFDVSVTPDGGSPITLQLTQQFYAE